MSNCRLHRGLFVASSLALLAIGSLASVQADRHQEEITRTAPVEQGQRLEIRHEQGSVTVHTAEQRQVTVQVKTILDGTKNAIRSYLEGLKTAVEPAREGDVCRVVTTRPAGEWTGLTQRTVDLDVTVLKGVPVEVNSSFGDLDVKGVAGLKATLPWGAMKVQEIEGDVTLEGRHDKISVAGAEGDVQITHSFGDVDVTRVGGSLTVRNQLAAIRAEGIGRKVEADNRSGAITLINVVGGANVTCQNGQVDVSRIQGGLTVKNRDESVNATDVQGNVEIDNRGGKVTAQQVAGKLKVQQGNGPLSVRGVRGTAELTNNRGLIEVDGVTGDLTARNQFARISVRNVTGSLEAMNAMGSLEVTLSPAQAAKDARDWKLQTDHANVIIRVPEGTGCTLHAVVRSGKIDSRDFPLRRRRDGQTETADAQINGGGAKVNVTVDLGMVQIVKVPASPARP